MGGFFGGVDDFFGEGGVADEAGAAAAADDFGYGAAHVDVDAVELHFICDFFDDLGVVFGGISPDLGDDFDVFLAE